MSALYSDRKSNGLDPTSTLYDVGYYDGLMVGPLSGGTHRQKYFIFEGATTNAAIYVDALSVSEVRAIETTTNGAAWASATAATFSSVLGGDTDVPFSWDGGGERDVERVANQSDAVSDKTDEHCCASCLRGMLLVGTMLA